MADSREDDLFRHTSMTFGEHLEELRASLFKAVMSLAIGFCIGLWFAPTIVQWIQSPLEKALKVYYSKESLEYFNTLVPENLRADEATQEAMKKLVFTDGLKPEQAFVAPMDILKRLQEKYPKGFSGIELPRSEKKEAQQTSAGDPETTREVGSPPVEAPEAKKAQGTGKTVATVDDMIPIVMWRPLSEDERLKVKNFNVQESFMIYIKAAFLFGAIVSSPFAFYFLWAFVAAGLYPHEKKYVHTFLPISVGLFLSGAAMAFFFVFPPVLNFFFGITKSMGQGLEPRISEWLSFVLLLPLGFGISFQLPLVMLFLARINIFSVETYLAKWRIAVLLMAVAAMVLSPGGDPYSMMMMLVPLICLYFGGIGLCKWLPAGRMTAEG